MTFAKPELSVAANSFRSALRVPIMNKKNASKADKAGEEKDENNKLMAVITINSKKIKYAVGQIRICIGSAPCLTNIKANEMPKAITNEFTNKVRHKPKYLPKMNSCRCSGFASKL